MPGIEKGQLGVTERLRTKVRKARSGSAFATSRLAKQYGSSGAVSKALSRLHQEGKLARVSQGIYCKPIKSKFVGEVLPPAESVAEFQARVRGERVELGGAEAARLFRLSTQVPMRAIYHTDGRSRTVEIRGHEIEFRHLNPMLLRRAGTKVGRAIVALHYVGSQELNEEVAGRVVAELSPRERMLLRRELTVLPAWMRHPITSALDKIEAACRRSGQF